MIDVRELRIGNLFQFPVKDGLEYWDVCDILSNPPEVYFTQNEQYNHYTNLTPIQLTEDVLLKCGFDELDLSNGSIIIYQNEEGKEDGFIIRTLSNVKVFRHLHKLQNYYYALKEQELQIQL